MYRHSFQLQSRHSFLCLSSPSNVHAWRVGTSPFRNRGFISRHEVGLNPNAYRTFATKSNADLHSEDSAGNENLPVESVGITDHLADSARSSQVKDNSSTKDVGLSTSAKDGRPLTKSTESQGDNVSGAIDGSKVQKSRKAAQQSARRARRRARLRIAKKASKLAFQPPETKTKEPSKDAVATTEVGTEVGGEAISKQSKDEPRILYQNSSTAAVDTKDDVSDGSIQSLSVAPKKKTRKDKSKPLNTSIPDVVSGIEIDTIRADTKEDFKIEPSATTTLTPKSSSKQAQEPSLVALPTSQLSQHATPVQTVQDDLMQKLKSITREQSRTMAKQALIDLLRNKRDTLTRAGRQVIMRKLRSYLVTRNGATIEDVIEEATGRGPLLEAVAPAKPNYIAPAGTSIKEAMKAGNKFKSAGKETIESLKEMPHMKDYEIKSISADDLTLVPHDKPQPPVPLLAYGLDRALFNPGVYHLRDPRSRVFNFDPYLQTIMPVAEFDFDALKAYITSSRDKALIGAAQHLRKKYTGSTSSMTSALAHFHFLLSQWRDVNISNLSKGFPDSLVSFTAMQRCPTAIFLRWRDGTYAIDADKQYDTPNILAMLGKSMEKLLTLPTEDFERYRKPHSSQISAEERDEAESFHYTTHGDFLLRSQLDAYDSRLPGTGMFDLKTRAVVSIRVDAKNYEQGQGYEITGRHGEFQSFEREYYDMIRSAFLKYSLQVRMGRMDGIFVAFHNTERIFGFQYISISEMDTAIHGTEDTTIGDSEFKLSLELLNRVLDRATKRFPEQSLQIHFETRESKNSTFLYIFAKPVSEIDIQKLQDTGKEEVIKFEKKVLGLHKNSDLDEDVDENAEEAKAQWDALQAEVEEEIEDEELQIKGTFDTGADVIDSQQLGDEGARNHGRSEPDDALEVNDIISAMNDGEMIADREHSTHEQLNDTTTNHNQEAPSNPIVRRSLAESGRGLGTEKEPLDPSQPARTSEVVPPKRDLEAAPLPTQAKSADRSTGLSRSLGKRDIADSNSAFATAIQHEAENKGKQEDCDGEDEKKGKEKDNLLAMCLTIRNKVNGEYVIRPENLSKDDTWSVEYALSRIPTHPRGETLYNSTLKRRKATMMSDRKDTGGYRDQYIEKLRGMARQGREFRRKQDELDLNEPAKVLRLNPSP